MNLEKDWWKLEPNDDDLADAMWGCGRSEIEEDDDEDDDQESEEMEKVHREISPETKKRIEEGRVRLWMQGEHYQSRKKHIENGGTIESWRP